MMRSPARSLAALVLATVGLACSSLPAPTHFAGTVSSPRRLADSTEHLVSYATLASDSAAVVAALVDTDTALADMRDRVRSARAGAESAANRVSLALRQGDRLRRDVVARTRASRQADEYEHFWQLGRDRLVLARAFSHDAVAGADSALSCVDTGCTRSRTRFVHTQLTSASGAAREAESLVRVAMRYVD